MYKNIYKFLYEKAHNKNLKNVITHFMQKSRAPSYNL